MKNAKALREKTALLLKNDENDPEKASILGEVYRLIEEEELEAKATEEKNKKLFDEYIDLLKNPRMAGNDPETVKTEEPPKSLEEKLKEALEKKGK